MSRRFKTIPKFKSEAAERAFWEAQGNDSTEYVDWSRAKVALPDDEARTWRRDLRTARKTIKAPADKWK